MSRTEDGYKKFSCQSVDVARLGLAFLLHFSKRRRSTAVVNILYEDLSAGEFLKS